MTPDARPLKRGHDDTDPSARDEAADLHPDVRAIMQATDRLPVHDDASVPVIELPTEAGTVRASLPADATDQEAAVIAVALTAHLRDEAVAAADDGPSVADPWRLCNRVGREVGARLRRTPTVGDAWKLAGRVRSRR